MQITKKLGDHRPLILVLFLAVAGTLCLASSMRYLKMPFSPWFGLVSAGIIFAIYLLNCFTDIREDFANDLGKLLFFTNRKFLYQIGIVTLCFVLFLLTVQRKLVVYPVVLVSIGILYSFRLIPWYSASQGFHFRRLKEFVLVKNLLVAALWGCSLFILPAIFMDVPIRFTHPTIALMMAIAVSTFSNTMFNDVRDIVGDRIAGNTTIPTLLGTRATYAILMLINLLWMASAGWMRQANWIDTPHLAFIAVLAVFPFSCIFLYRRNLLSRSDMDFFSECDLLIFAAGVFLLV